MPIRSKNVRKGSKPQYKPWRKSQVPRRGIWSLPRDPLVHRFMRMCNQLEIQNKATGGAPDWTVAAAGSTVPITLASANTGFMTGTVQGGFALTHTLGDVLSFSEFTALFDAYKILKVHVTIHIATGGSTNGATAQAPSLLYAVDTDDAAVPGSEGGVREKYGCKLAQLTSDRPLYITYVPKHALQPVNPGLTGIGEGSGWVDCGSYDVLFFGLKGFITNFQSNTDGTPATRLRFDMKYELAFKRTR